MTSSVAGLRRSSKALPKAKLASEKDHGHCLVVGWPFDLRQFLNLSEIITSEKYAQEVDETYRELQHLQPALINRKGPIFLHETPNHTSHNQHFKSWTNWATKFCLIHHIHLISYQSTTTSSSILTTFAGKTLSKTAESRKCFPRDGQIPRCGFSCYRNKQTYFSLAKMCWL